LKRKKSKENSNAEACMAAMKNIRKTLIENPEKTYLLVAESIEESIILKYIFKK
jgi:hypothetical protein